MFTHDVIKMEYSKQGYLPNYPYHLISDAEMFDSFLCFRCIVTEEDASKIVQGDFSLWESPKSYVSLYKLKSYEFIQEDGVTKLLLEGSKSKLSDFNILSGLDADCVLSPDCYFSVNYPLLFDTFEEVYDKLTEALVFHIDEYLNSLNSPELYVIPDWVYSYMLGTVISVNSSQQDIHDMLVLLGLDNLDDVFTEKIFQSCLEISTKWVNKLPPDKNTMRPPTIFGELHVIKSLRVSGLLDDDEPY